MLSLCGAVGNASGFPEDRWFEPSQRNNAKKGFNPMATNILGCLFYDIQ